jgi:hypothetical protein
MDRIEVSSTHLQAISAEADPLQKVDKLTAPIAAKSRFWKGGQGAIAPSQPANQIEEAISRKLSISNFIAFSSPVGCVRQSRNASLTRLELNALR